MKAKCVADIERPWVEPAGDSGLIQHCRDNWLTPVTRGTNHVLTTFIRQKLALIIVAPEAISRLNCDYVDGIELYDEELEVVLNELPRTEHSFKPTTLRGATLFRRNT